MKRIDSKPARAKKLEIQRETLRRLHDDWLRQIHGKDWPTERPRQSHAESCVA